VFIYKSILGLLPSYFCYLTQHKPVGVYLRSQDLYSLSAPLAQTEFGKQAFRYVAPILQNDMKLLSLHIYIYIRAVLKLIAIGFDSFWVYQTGNL